MLAIKCEMSESNVTCKHCRRKVPAGKFCSECGNKIATESRDGATNEEPRPPIQASDALSAYGIKVSSQQVTGTSTLASASFSVTLATNNSSTYQGNGIETAATVLLDSAISEIEAQCQQQNIQQIQQSSSLGSVAGVTYVDNSSGRSGAQPITHSGAPRTPDREIGLDGNSWFEVYMDFMNL